MKKKILIIINSELYVRNYLKTNIFKILNTKYQIFFLANSEIKNRILLKKQNNFEGFYSFSQKENIKTNRIMNISMWRYRSRSKSFLYRVKWFSEINFFEIFENTTSKLIISKFLKIINVLKFNILIRVMGNKYIFPIFKKFYIDKNNVSKKLERKILKIKPDLIIFPTQSQSKADYDLVKICKENKIKSFFLIDNWDNLSDKSIIIDKPDVIGVWRKQTKKHAVDIQKFRRNQVYPIGTPRFEVYFQQRFKKVKNLFNFKYILFLGTALEFDEYKIVNKISQILKNNEEFKKIKLVYRPHPWRMSKHEINFSNLDNVILDPQIADIYFKKKIDLSFQPNLNYYPSLIKNSEFVIGGLTSMIIESMIMYKKYLITALPEKKFNNQYNSSHYHTHFKELKYSKYVKFCYSFENLENFFFTLWNNRVVNDLKKVDKERNYYLHKDKNNYSKRILKIVNVVLNNEEL